MQENSAVRPNAGYSRYAPPADHPDISPPDSPIEFDGSHRPESPDISPISETPEQTFPPVKKKTRFESQLPVLRKDTPAQQPSAGQRLERTKWDDMSGEPTTSDSGKTGQVAPGDSPYQVESRTSGKPGSTLLGAGKEKINAGKIFSKARDHVSKDKKDQKPPAREPWKGASGRFPIVNPIESKPASQARVFNRSPSPYNDLNFGNLHGYTITTVTAGNSSTSQADKKRTEEKKRATEDKKNAKVSQSSAAQVPSQKATVNSSQAGTSTLSNAQTGQATESRGNENTSRRADPAGSNLASIFQDLNLSNEPGSRFSATTCATTEAGPSRSESPRAESRAETPPAPAVQESVLNRKRPIPKAGVPAKSMTRKPTPSAAATSDAEKSKSVPDGPPEVQVQSRINSLEARRNELAVRKANINTIIYELTQVIQPSSIAYDMATRDEVKKTVASLNNELDDIKKEEHDIGLKLIRAWKKRDELEAYDASSSLWVKRVTS